MIHKQLAVRHRNVLTHGALSQAIYFGIGLRPSLQVCESRHDLKALLSFASNPPCTRRVRRCHQQPWIGQLSLRGALY